MSAVIDVGSTRARPKPARPARSRLAQPLIASLGVLTLLAGGSAVARAATASRSARPQDWSRLDWTAVTGRHRLCIEREGPGALGCMLTTGARPVTAADPTSPPAQRDAPIYSIAVIHDSPPPAAAKRPAKRAPTVGPAPSPTPVPGGRSPLPSPSPRFPVRPTPPVGDD